MTKFHTVFLHTAQIILVVAVLLFCTTGCAKKTVAHPEGTFTVTATFYPLYIMLENITENVPDVVVEIMAPPVAGCLHDYQFTVSDMKKLDRSSVIVCNGAGMESFMKKYLDDPTKKVITAAEGIPLIDDDRSEHHHDTDADHDGEEHHHHDMAGNPHVWVSIPGAIAEVTQITKELAAFDSAHAAMYKANADRYCKALQSLYEEMSATLAPFAGSKIVTFHEAFPYFARDFNLEIAAVIEQEADTEPSAKELLETVTIIKVNHITALFAEPQYTATAADVISRETGVPVSLLDPCVTGSLDKNAYITAMRANLATLQCVLGNN